jgi:hypothetical protein
MTQAGQRLKLDTFDIVKNDSDRKTRTYLAFATKKRINIENVL